MQKKIIWQEEGDFKKIYYDTERTTVMKVVLSRMLEGLYNKGYLTNEVDISMGFEDTENRGRVLKIKLDVLEQEE